MAQQQNITAMIYDKRGKLISMGKNSYVKTHPLQARAAKEVGEEHKIYLHAEVDALRRLKNWDRAYKMVVSRTKRDGTHGNAQPCRVCQRVIKLAGISVIEHT